MLKDRSVGALKTLNELKARSNPCHLKFWGRVWKAIWTNVDVLEQTAIEVCVCVVVQACRITILYIIVLIEFDKFYKQNYFYFILFIFYYILVLQFIFSHLIFLKCLTKHIRTVVWCVCVGVQSCKIIILYIIVLIMNYFISFIFHFICFILFIFMFFF